MPRDRLAVVSTGDPQQVFLALTFLALGLRAGPWRLPSFQATSPRG